MTAADDRRLWLEARRTGCGASDVAGICGASPWSSPWSIWASKVGLVPLDPTLDDDDPRTFGLDLEPVIAAKFERRTGLYVVGKQRMIHHPDEPWQFATVDGLVYDRAFRELDGNVTEWNTADALGVFESKYTGDPPWDDIPDHYRIAGDWQMYVTGLDRLWLACLHLPFGRPRLRIYEQERDDTRILDLVAAVETFWFDHVVTGRPPAADAHRATTEAMRAAWGSDATAKLPTIYLDDYAKVVTQLSEVRKEIKGLEFLETLSENTLKKVIAERGERRPRPDPDCPTCRGQGVAVTATPAEVDEGFDLGEFYLPCPECPTPILFDALSDGYIDGDLAVSWRSQSDRRIDTDAVRADHGDRYDKVGTKRVLRLHGKHLP